MRNGEKWARSGVSFHCFIDPLPSQGWPFVTCGSVGLCSRNSWPMEQKTNFQQKRETPTWIPSLVKLLFVTSSIRRYGVYFSTAKQAKATSSSPRENANKRRKKRSCCWASNNRIQNENKKKKRCTIASFGQHTFGRSAVLISWPIFIFSRCFVRFWGTKVAIQPHWLATTADLSQSPLSWFFLGWGVL